MAGLLKSPALSVGTIPNHDFVMMVPPFTVTFPSEQRLTDEALSFVQAAASKKESVAANLYSSRLILPIEELPKYLEKISDILSLSAV